MRTYYFKLNGDIIFDAIDYAFNGYIEVQLPDERLPVGINGGWYRWNGEMYVFDQALYDALYIPPEVGE